MKSTEYARGILIPEVILNVLHMTMQNFECTYQYLPGQDGPITTATTEYRLQMSGLDNPMSGLDNQTQKHWHAWVAQTIVYAHSETQY